MMQFSPQDKVFYVESRDDETVLVAMNVTVHPDEISWFDTVKERIMRIERVIHQTEDTFEFERNDKRIYRFSPMTLEIYKSRVKPRLNEPKDFATIEEMYNGFKETMNNSW